MPPCSGAWVIQNFDEDIYNDEYRQCGGKCSNDIRTALRSGRRRRADSGVEVAAAAAITVLLKNPERKIHINKGFSLRPDWSYIKKILRIGVPNSVENSMFQLGKLILLSMISGFGTASIAANAVGNAVSMVAVLPGMAMGYGVVSVISVCVGAGDYLQVRFYARKLMKWVYAAMFISNAAIILGAAVYHKNIRPVG